MTQVYYAACDVRLEQLRHQGLLALPTLDPASPTVPLDRPRPGHPLAGAGHRERDRPEYQPLDHSGRSLARVRLVLRSGVAMIRVGPARPASRAEAHPVPGIRWSTGGTASERGQGAVHRRGTAAGTTCSRRSTSAARVSTAPTYGQVVGQVPVDHQPFAHLDRTAHSRLAWPRWQSVPRRAGLHARTGGASVTSARRWRSTASTRLTNRRPHLGLGRLGVPAAGGRCRVRISQPPGRWSANTSANRETAGQRRGTIRYHVRSNAHPDAHAHRHPRLRHRGHRPPRRPSPSSTANTTRCVPCRATVAFRIYASREDDTRITVVHEWDDQASFAGYLKSDCFPRSGEVLRPLMTRIAR